MNESFNYIHTTMLLNYKKNKINLNNAPSLNFINGIYHKIRSEDNIYCKINQLWEEHIENIYMELLFMSKIPIHKEYIKDICNRIPYPYQNSRFIKIFWKAEYPLN